MHAKFYVNRFRGFGVLAPPISPISKGLAGRPYNGVSTTVLHCEMHIHLNSRGSTGDARRLHSAVNQWQPGPFSKLLWPLVDDDDVCRL